MLAGEALFGESHFTFTCRILAYLFLMSLPLIAYKFYKTLSEIGSKRLQLISIAMALFYIALFFWVYPGFVSYDDVFGSQIILAGKAWGWQSLTYSFILGVGFLLLGNFGFTVILSIALFLYLFVKTMAVVDRSAITQGQKTILACGLLFLSAHPLNQALLLFHCRDTLFSLLLVLLGFQLLRDSKTWNWFRIVCFSMSIVILGELRQEAKIYLFLFPLILWLLKWSRSQLSILLGSLFFFSAIYYTKLTKFYEVVPYSYSYQVTAVVLPLSQIFHDLPPEQISELHRTNIGKVLDTVKLKEKFNPIDIDPFHAGAFNHRTTPEQWKDFKMSAFQLILENPKIFLKNRIVLTKSMLNIGRPPLIVTDELRLNKSAYFASILERTNLAGKITRLSEFAKYYRLKLFEMKRNDNFVIYLFCSFLLPLVFIIYCLVRPIDLTFAAFALVVAFRLPVLFLLAGGSYAKYIYSLMVFFTFGLILYIAKALERKKDSRRGED